MTTIHITTDGRFHCDGLAKAHPGIRTIRIGGEAEPGEITCRSCPRFARCGMSHITAGAAEMADIAAIEALCKTKGWTFKRNQTTYKWYGTYVGDAKLPEGMKVEDLGKCSHAIGIPGTTWEIGLVKNQKTGGYRLAYDYWGPSGAPLQAAVGKDGGAFLQGYADAKASIIARKIGGMVQKTILKNGTIKLQVTGV